MAASAEFSSIATTLVEDSVVFLDIDLGESKESILKRLIGAAVAAGRAADDKDIVQAALRREEQAPTGLPGGVAVPHCRHTDWLKPTLLFARLPRETQFSTPDGPADLLFFIGVPEDAGAIHIDILSALAKSIRSKAFRAELRGTESNEEAVRIITEHLLNAPRKKSQKELANRVSSDSQDKKPELSVQPTRIVAVTACPTGIAHTYLAADALTAAAKSIENTRISVETQGSAGTRAVSAQAIQRADVVVIAADIQVSGLERFGDLPILKVPIKKAVNSANEVISEALSLAARPKHSRANHQPFMPNGDAAASETEESSVRGVGLWVRVRNAVMTGVSFMIPFVAASGLLIALGFLVGGHQTAQVSDVVSKNLTLFEAIDFQAPIPVPTDDGSTVLFDRDGLWMYLGSVLFAIGVHGMQVIVAVLSAFIAFGLSGRPGIAPGFIGGAIAVTVGAGFLGGLVTGIAAGLIVMGLLKIRVPAWLEALMPVVVIPLLGSMAVGLLMYLFLGAPLSWLMMNLQGWLSGMDTAHALVFGGILGAMMCVDMGGMINKSAYLFATASVSSPDPASWKIMAAVMAAGMVPPLATSIASFLRPRLFTSAEHQNGKAGWMLGAAFVSEGAIPFAANDPLRIIPSIVVGGAVTGGMSMALGAATRVPHGGVFVLFAIDHPVAWLGSIATGSVVAAALILTLKSLFYRRKPEATTDEVIAQPES